MADSYTYLCPLTTVSEDELKTGKFEVPAKMTQSPSLITDNEFLSSQQIAAITYAQQMAIADFKTAKLNEDDEIVKLTGCNTISSYVMLLANCIVSYNQAVLEHVEQRVQVELPESSEAENDAILCSVVSSNQSLLSGISDADAMKFLKTYVEPIANTTSLKAPKTYESAFNTALNSIDNELTGIGYDAMSNIPGYTDWIYAYKQPQLEKIEIISLR